MPIDSEKLYEDYHLKVLHYILSKVNDYTLAEDLCSDVFVKVYEKLDSFDETKASVSTWIFTITKNKLIDYYRSRKVMVEIPETLTYEENTSLYDEETLESLAKALEKLNPRDRKVIIRHYYKGESLKDIAESMGISYSYIKILHKKALFLLKMSI